ncbi:MAG: TIGR03862 family flavoprotein [Litoreibacter sp.]
MTTAVVVGAGPAGLMAAEALADGGVSVIVVDQKPSVGRKFLMAGKSGLNLTKDEDPAAFLAAFGCDAIAPMINQFGPRDVVEWANNLDQDVFTGTSGRVFPTVMKASPLLRAWLGRLRGKDVEFRTQWVWKGFQDDSLCFETPNGIQTLAPTVSVLALGGASWRRLGSDGEWVGGLSPVATVTPFKPSNMGLTVEWSRYMEPHFGAPLKNIRLMAGTARVKAEAVISRNGLEGGGIYAISAKVRDGAELFIDLLPDLSETEIDKRLAEPMGKTTLSNVLRKRLKLGAAKLALLNEFGRPFPDNLAGLLKALPISHKGPADIDGAISTAGGVAFDAVDESLMLHLRPGTFVAGEMLDWEAPTGGYLITGCLATGLWAGQKAARWVHEPVATT